MACRRSVTRCVVSSTFQIDVRGTKSDLHSGVFGGAVANPAMVLSQILAQMKDRGGRIKVPGFYDHVRPLSNDERAAWKTLPFNEKKYRKDLGAPKLFGETGYHAGARVGAPDLRGQRCCPASPAKARRPSSPPWRWRR